MKRIEANDPAGMRQMGMHRFMTGGYNSVVFDYWTNPDRKFRSISDSS